MKKSQNRALLVLSTFVALSLASCSGLTPSANSILPGSGSEGSVSVDSSFDGDARIREIYDLYVKKVLAEGETPSSYEEWLESIKGKDGTTFLFGLTDPAQDIGNVGDVYLNTSSWDVYVKSTEGWTKVGNILGGQGIQGPQGEKGEKGDKGDPGVQGDKGDKGEPGNTPYIGDNGHWWIGDQDTGIPATGAQGEPGEKGDKGDTGAQGDKGDKGDKGDTGAQGDKGDKGDKGADGQTPYIGQNGNWWIGDVDTKVPATGSQGEQGQSGENGLTPYIGQNGNWWIGDKDTGVSATGAQGEKGDKGDKGDTGANGLTPYIGQNGNWWIGDKDTGIKAEGSAGQNGQNGQDGKDGLNGQNGKDGKDGKDGVDGRTAWSNTILPSVGGYVTVNYGSAYAGEPITFMAFPDKDYELADITLNGNSYAEMIDWSNNSLTVPMVEHGYVVRATFYYNDKPELHKVNFYGYVDQGDGVYWDRVGTYWIEAGSTLVDYADNMASMVVQHYEDRYSASAFQGWDTDLSMPVYGDLDIRAVYKSGEKEPITNREFYGTEHEGNLDDPFDNEDAIWVTKNLDSGDRGRDFVIEGTIDTFYNGPESRSDFQYAFYLTPEEEGGERFEAYNAHCVNEYGDRYELGFDNLFHGAHVVFEGPLTTYTYYTPFSGFYQATALYGEYYEKLDKELVFHCAFPHGDDAFNGQTSLIASWLAHDGDYTSYFQEKGFQATLGDVYGVEFSEGLCDALEGKTLAEIKSDEELFTFWSELISWWQAQKGGILDFFVAYSDRLSYQNVQCETESALIHSVDGTLPARAEHEATVAEAIAVAANMKVGDTTEDIYTITGYVVKRERGRYDEYLYYISDTKDIAAEDINAMNCFILDPYQIPDEDMLAALGLGAKISYRDHIHNYTGRAQSNRYFLDGANLTILEEGTPFASVLESIAVYDEGENPVAHGKVISGSSATFSLKALPEGASLDGVYIQVYGDGHASLDGDQLVVYANGGLSEGKIAIDFYNEDGSYICAFNLEVVKSGQEQPTLEGIGTSTPKLQGYVGESKELSLIPLPIGQASLMDLNLSFVSDDEAVATVDGRGRVTFVGVGECIIKAMEVNTGISRDYPITVMEHPEGILEPIDAFYTCNTIQYDDAYAGIFGTGDYDIDEILQFNSDGTFVMFDREGNKYRQTGYYYRYADHIVLDITHVQAYQLDYPYNDYPYDYWMTLDIGQNDALIDIESVSVGEGEYAEYSYTYNKVNFIKGDISGCSYLTAMLSTMPEGYEAEFLIADDFSIALYLLKHDGRVETNIAEVVPYGNGLYYLDGPNIFVTIDLAKGTIADPDVSEATIFATGTIYSSEFVLYDNGIFSVTNNYDGVVATRYGVYTANGDGVSYKLDGGSGSLNVTYTPSEVEGEPGTIRYEEPPIPQKMISYTATFDGDWDITKDDALIYVYYWDKSGDHLMQVKVAVGEGQQTTLNFELPESCEGFMILRINPKSFDGTLEKLDWDNDVWNKTDDYLPAKMDGSSFIFKF